MKYRVEIDGYGPELFEAANDTEAAKVIRHLVAQHPEWSEDCDVLVTDPDGKRWYSIVYKFR